MRVSGRRFWVGLLCLMLAVALTAAVAGCGSEDEASTDTTQAATETTAAATETTAAATETTAAATETTAAAATGVIKVGIIEPLTGTPIGLPWLYGYELLFDKVNEEGGIQIAGTTYTFEYYSGDSKFTPEGAAIAAKQLIEQEGVDVVCGPILDTAQAAVYAAAEPAEVLHLCAVNMPGSDPDISPDKPLMVRTFISCDSVWIPDLKYLKENWPDVKTLAVVVRDQGYEPWLETFYPLLADYGIEHVGTELIPIDTTDYVPTYTKVLSMEPDAICAFASHSAGDELNAARTLGFEGPFFNTSPLGAEIMAQQVSAEYANDAYCNGFNPFDPNELMQDVMDRWAAKYPDEQWVSDAFMGWDSGWCLIQAMEKAQSVDPYEIVTKGFDTLTNPGDLQTLLGDSRMGGMHRFGVNRALVRPIPMTRFVNGECVSEAYILPEVGEE